MILTYKIKHGIDLTDELRKAKKVAEFALQHKTISSADVKHIGLKSLIANQILRKYSRNRKLKKITNVKLTVPSQGIKVTISGIDTNGVTKKNIYIPSLKLNLVLDKVFLKVKQVELDDEYAYVSVSVSEEPEIIPKQFLGVDLNATGHCAVVANETTGKILKLGKRAQHIHTKYKNTRKHLQHEGRYKEVKKTKNRESRIVRDLNHKISRRIVDEAIKQKAGIVLENLKGIRKTKKQAKSFKYSLNSWSFYQLLLFILYKAKLHGIPVFKIDPRYTSQQCSKCGLLGIRNGKLFKCPACRHVEHADVNAAFVIAKRHKGTIRLLTERDVSKGATAVPHEATP